MRASTLILLSFSVVGLSNCGGSPASAPPPLIDPVPSISSLSPSFASTGGLAFILTVNGRNFIPSSTVQWNGSLRTTSYIGSTQLTASIAAADIDSAGTGNVTVNNPAPGGGSSPSVSFITIPTAVPLQNAPTPLVIPSYDGSGQVTEPDVVFFDKPWHGFSYWMAFSPYPNNDASKENPSIVASEDGVNWKVPLGLVNPLALPSNAFLADASIFYDQDSDQLWVYYIDASAQTNLLHVYRLISSDGVTWQNQGVLFQVPVYDALSPTVGQSTGSYYMWSINSGALGCYGTSSAVEYRTSPDGIQWSDPQPTNLSQPGYVIWHINVSYTPLKGEYLAAVAAYPDGSDCTHTVLFFATSQDGINWTSYNKVILGPGNDWDDGEIYRSSVLFDASSNLLQVWYSASSVAYEWHVGLTQADYDQFLEWLQQ